MSDALPATGERLLLLAPHLDDLPASAAALLLRGGRPTALTVCAGWRDGPLGWWDRRCGFRSPQHAAESRRAEDRAALAGLDVEILHLDFVDGQYPRPAGDSGALERDLRERVTAYDHVVAPAGIGGHVDHLWVRDTAIRARGEGQPLTLYGDYGYNLTHDWGESSGLAAHGILPVHFRSVALGPEEAARKRQMLEAYRSQAGAFASCPDSLELHVLAVEWYVRVPDHPEPVEPFDRPYRRAAAD